MAYEVTARRWRPQQFENVIAQEHVTTTLKNAIRSGQIAHAYLFAGPRGVGKTTTARILAKALNCVNGPTVTPCNACSFCKEIAEGRSLDVLEIDGASNNKVEQIRDHLLESVKYTPSQGKHKIYIIDEVHMLSPAAFNALLKTLEEPPPHVYFIFATTDPQKVLPTILSRCQRFDFRRVPGQMIVDHLAVIAEAAGWTVEREALAVIARRADGSLRDAESLFDQVAAFAGASLTAHDVAGVLGMVEQDVYFELTGILATRDVPRGLRLIEQLIQQGYNLDEIALGIIEHLRNLLMVKAAPEAPDLLDTAAVDLERYQAQAVHFQEEDLLRLMRLASEMEEAIKNSALPKIQLEMGIVRMIRLESSVLLTDVLKKLAELEQRLGGGTGAPESAHLDVLSGPDTAPSADPWKTGVSVAPTQYPNGEPKRQIAPSERVQPEATRPAPVEPSGPTLSVGHAPAETAVVSADPAENGALLPSDRQPVPDPTTPKNEPSGMGVQEITEHWSEVVQRIKQRRIALGNFLVAAVLADYRDNVVTIAFGSQHGFHRQQAEKRENTQLIQEEFAAVLKRPVRVVCTTAEIPLPAASEPQRLPGPPPRLSAAAILDQEPAVKRIVDAFGGHIVL